MHRLSCQWHPGPILNAAHPCSSSFGHSLMAVSKTGRASAPWTAVTSHRGTYCGLTGNLFQVAFIWKVIKVTVYIERIETKIRDFLWAEMHVAFLSPPPGLYAQPKRPKVGFVFSWSYWEILLTSTTVVGSRMVFQPVVSMVMVMVNGNKTIKIDTHSFFPHKKM